MKAFFILAAAGLLASASSSTSPAASLPVLSEADYERAWSEWKSEHGEISLSLEPSEVFRYQNFRVNVDRVRQHNARAEDGEFTFTLALNRLADLSDAEYRATMLMPKGAHRAPSAEAKRRVLLGDDQKKEKAFGNSTAPVPAAWDWRDTPNVVNPPKNQGACGSCWAFSAVATMEGAWNKKHGKLSSFSEQQLVDCTLGGKDACDVGGEMYDGVAEGAKEGMELESAYQYLATSGGGCKFKPDKVVGHFSGYRNITSGDEAALKVATYQQPIISVGIDASSFWFQLYHKGVFNMHGFYGKCKNSIDQLDHGVAVVGYGHDPKGGLDYWTVRNSWGAQWGEKGYIRMARNRGNQCGVATQACFALL